MLTVYNLNPAKANAVAIIDTSSSDQKKTFTGYTLSFNLRLPHGARAFGGFNAERVLYSNCAQPDDSSAFGRPASTLVGVGIQVRF